MLFACGHRWRIVTDDWEACGDIRDMRNGGGMLGVTPRYTCNVCNAIRLFVMTQSCRVTTRLVSDWSMRSFRASHRLNGELSSAWTRLSSVLIWILHISNFILPSVFSWLNQKSKYPNIKSFERLVGRNFIDDRSGSECICCDISRSLFPRHEAAFLCSADCKGIILWNNGRAMVPRYPVLLLSMPQNK